MICTNVDKCSAKIFFAVSMGYSACLFQVLIETFSRKLTNLLWSAMASFGPQSDFPKTFCSIFFSLVNHVIWHFWTMYFWSSSGVYLHVFCFQLQIIGFQYQQFFLVLGWYFNLESAVNWDCIFSFSSCVIRRA